jgi:hypothetical protein
MHDDSPVGCFLILIVILIIIATLVESCNSHENDITTYDSDIQVTTNLDNVDIITTNIDTLYYDIKSNTNYGYEVHCLVPIFDETGKPAKEFNKSIAFTETDIGSGLTNVQIVRDANGWLYYMTCSASSYGYQVINLSPIFDEHGVICK